MNSIDAIKRLPYWNGIRPDVIQQFCNEAETVHLKEGAVITEQFKSATDFYLLCNGGVDHYLTLLSEKRAPIPVGRLKAAWSAIGWSGFLEPHRYTTQTQSSVPSILFRWQYDALKQLTKDDPIFYRGLLALAIESSKTLLEETRNLLKPLPTYTVGISDTPNSYHKPPRLRLRIESDSCINHLSYSNLFQGLKFHELKLLAEHCWLERCGKGMEICIENQKYTDLMILVRGTVNLYYSNKTDGHIGSETSNVFVRSLSQPGQVISWTALTQSQQQDISACAEDNVSICCIPVEAFKNYCESRPAFAIKIRENLLSVIGSRLRSTRAVLINQYTGNEKDTVSSLLHNIGPQLTIDSPLHKVSYLLNNRNTQEDAFHYIDRAQLRGNPLENNVAGLCSDILTETRKESQFYKGLSSIYQMVVTANITETPQSIRNKSAREFANVFSHTRYRIKGEHYLPKSSGHIFILNHLVSHPYHKLPNGFEFSLDTHFVSSMILYPNYGDSGLRVVRKNRNEEYGHEAYYQRLGHIYVYTNESQTIGNGIDTINPNQGFFAEATRHLEHGRNIIICPEGTTHSSKDSPGAFRSGAFRLAAMQKAETLIVPIAVANFDKLLPEAVFTAVIKPPFRIHNVMDGHNPHSMRLFLESFNAEFKSYVKEAQRLGNTE